MVAAALLVSPVGSQQAGGQLSDLEKREAVIRGLKKLMPADQLAFVEKVEERNKLGREASEEKNGLKRKEMQDKASVRGKQLRAELIRKIQKEGLKDWVGVLSEEVSADAVTVFVPKCTRLRLEIDGMRKEAKEAVKTFQRGDLVRFTIVVPNPKLTFPNDWEMWWWEGGRTVVPGRDVRKIEKAGKK